VVLYMIKAAWHNNSFLFFEVKQNMPGLIIRGQVVLNDRGTTILTIIDDNGG